MIDRCDRYDRCKQKFSDLDLWLGSLKHARFWDADGNRKSAFRVLESSCLPNFYTTHL